MTGGLIAVAVIIGSLVAHEWAHAIVAWSLGDKTAADRGRLSWNPMRHIDPFLTVIFPFVTWLASHGLIVLGAAKPMPIAWQKLERGRIPALAVALAGIGMNASLGWLGWVMGWQLLERVSLALVVFNLLPIPPLDGYRVLGILWPELAFRIDIIPRRLRLIWHGPLMAHEHDRLIAGLRSDMETVGTRHAQALKRTVDVLNTTSLVAMDVDQRLDYHERAVMALRQSRARLDKHREGMQRAAEDATKTNGDHPPAEPAVKLLPFGKGGKSDLSLVPGDIIIDEDGG